MKISEFEAEVYAVTRLIPPGQVASYGQVATYVVSPRHARAVGTALRHLPPELFEEIPWHRVINAQGRISIPDDSAGHYTQRERLEAEGILFRPNKSIDMGRFRWQP